MPCLPSQLRSISSELVICWLHIKGRKIRKNSSQSLQRKLHRGPVLLIHALGGIRIQNFRGYGETPAFRRDVNHLALRHGERYHVQMAAVAQHQRQRAHVRQRFLLLGFLRFRHGRRHAQFAAHIIAILSAFVPPILVAPSLLIIRRSLLVIALRVVLLHRLLWLVRCRIARRRVIISANSQQINYPRRSNPGRTNRWRIMPGTQRPADRRENSVACVLISRR